MTAGTFPHRYIRSSGGKAAGLVPMLRVLNTLLPRTLREILAHTILDFNFCLIPNVFL